MSGKVVYICCVIKFYMGAAARQFGLEEMSGEAEAGWANALKGRWGLAHLAGCMQTCSLVLRHAPRRAHTDPGIGCDF